MKIKIATWNINSIRLRENHVCSLLVDYEPDIICLQELKAPIESVPTRKFIELGYKYLVIRGQKGYNGVAIISRIPIVDVGSHDYCLKGDARHVCARLANGVEIQNFYIPAGGDLADRELNKKFEHKLDFLDEMATNFNKSQLSKTILGRRLDHIWATSDIAAKSHSSFILKEARSWERPSDHVPVFAEFDL